MRATTSAAITSAPASRSAWAAARMVAAVVTTSSTRSRCSSPAGHRPRGSCRAGLARRCAPAEGALSCSVPPPQSAGEGARSNARRGGTASASAWLKPRGRWRRHESGTGTTLAVAPRRGRPRPEHRGEVVGEELEAPELQRSQDGADRLDILEDAMKGVERGRRAAAAIADPRPRHGQRLRAAGAARAVERLQRCPRQPSHSARGGVGSGSALPQPRHGTGKAACNDPGQQRTPDVVEGLPRRKETKNGRLYLRSKALRGRDRAELPAARGGPQQEERVCRVPSPSSRCCSSR